MASNDAFQALTDLQTAITQLNEILLGDENNSVNIGGVVKPSIAKSIYDQFDILRSIVSGQRVAYNTRAELLADLNHPANTLGEVVRDPTSSYNSVYIKSGASGTGTWLISSYDRFADLEDRIKLARTFILGWIENFEATGPNAQVQNVGTAPGTGIIYNIKWARLYIYHGGIQSIAAYEGTVAHGEALYIDLDAPLVNGAIEVKKAPDSFWGSENFVEGRKFLLFGQNYGRYSGLLSVQANLYDLKKVKDDVDHIGTTLSSRVRNSFVKPLITFDSDVTVKLNSDSSMDVTFARGYIYRAATGKLPIFLEGGTYNVPDKQGLYFEFSEDINDTTMVVPKVTSSAFYSGVENGPNGFAGDNKIMLLANYATRYWGELAPFVKTTSDIAAKKSRIQLWPTKINVIDLNGAANRAVLEWTDPIYVFDGAGDTPVKIAPLPQTTIGNMGGIYIDLDETPVNGFIQPHVIPNNYVFSSVTYGKKAFVEDNKILLFATANGTQGGVLLDYIRDEFTRTDPWLGQIVMKTDPASTVEFDPATLTLSWSGELLFQMAGANRIKLAPGSVQFDSGQFQVAWLDLTMLNFTQTPANAVKVGRYYTGEDRFIGSASQVPLFFYNRGEYGTIGGFPEPEGFAQTAFLKDEIIIDQQPTYMKVYIKAAESGNKYFQYNFIMFDEPSNVYKGWRLDKHFIATRNSEFQFTQGKQITNGGEWECAIKQSGTTDFMGGRAHGHELAFMNNLYVDGVKVEWGLEQFIKCSKIKMIQGSKLIEDNTTNEVCTKYTTWDITADELLLTHHIEWLASISLADTYLCMLPIIRYSDMNGQITEAGAREPYWQEEEMVTTQFSPIFSTAGHAMIWGPEVSAEVKVLSGWDKPGRHFNFSNAAAYNKFYFDSTGNYTTSIGEVWDQVSSYKFGLR